MPTYDYKCKRCSYQFEAFQSILSEPIKTCPRCMDGKVERLISAGAGLIFKGSGFYETDYKRKSNGSNNKYSVPKSASSDTVAETVSTPAADIKTDK